MKIYVVVAPFYDLKDPVKFDHTKDGDIPKEYHLYNVGDVYPRIGGPMPEPNRVLQLSGDWNAQGKPLIQEVEVPDEPGPAEAAADVPEKPKAEPEKTKEPAPKAEKPKKRSAK